MAKHQRNYSLLVVFAIVTWLFAGSEILQRATIELRGTVTASNTSCVQPQNNRCATEYVVEADKNIHRTYVAGPTDKALKRRLPVGTVIVKEKWALSYSIDGVLINDFPSVFYWGQMAFGLCCVLLFCVLSKRDA